MLTYIYVYIYERYFASLLSCVWPFCDPMNCRGVCQAPLSTEFPRQEYWSGLSFPSPGVLSNPGIKPVLPALAGRFFTTEPPGNPSERCRHRQKFVWVNDNQLGTGLWMLLAFFLLVSLKCFSNKEHVVYVKKCYIYLKSFRFSCLPSSSLFLVLGTRDRQHSLNFHLTSFSSVQLLSRVWLFATPWTAACQDSLSITNSWSLSKLMSIELVMPYNHLILCHPLFLLPSIFPSIRVFSNESALHIR